MSVDLSGVDAKLERAKFHCETINAAAREYTEVDLPNAARERLSRFPLYSLNEDWQHDALALVYDFQSFNRMPRRSAVAAPFYKLLRLSNEDKHRTLHWAASYSADAPVNFRITPSGYIRFRKIRRPNSGVIIENGAEIASVKIAIVKRPPPDVQMKVSFTLHADMAFLAGDQAIARLSDLDPMVAEARELLRRALRLPEVSA